MKNPEEELEAAAYARVSSPGLKNSPTLEGQMETLKEAMNQRGYHYTPKPFTLCASS